MSGKFWVVKDCFRGSNILLVRHLCTAKKKSFPLHPSQTHILRCPLKKSLSRFPHFCPIFFSHFCSNQPQLYFHVKKSCPILSKEKRIKGYFSLNPSLIFSILYSLNLKDLFLSFFLFLLLTEPCSLSPAFVLVEVFRRKEFVL